MGCSHSIFLPLSQGHQQSQAVLGWSQIVSLVSALYSNVPLTLQVFCEPGLSSVWQCALNITSIFSKL